MFACCLLFPLLLPNSELGIADSSSTIEVKNQLFDLGEYIFRTPTDRLVSRGTSVRKARQSDQDNKWTLCAKSSWQYQDRANELKALRALQDIPGVVRLVAGQLIMVDGKEDSISRCRLDMPMQRAKIFEDLASVKTGDKRRHESSHYDDCAAKKRHVNGPTTKESMEELSAKLSWTPVEVSTYDKVHMIIVMKICSRPYDAEENTPLQKMECLRRVLKTLRASRDKGWLHRDISFANIMIPENEEGLRGSIINWDMAREVDDIDNG